MNPERNHPNEPYGCEARKGIGARKGRGSVLTAGLIMSRPGYSESLSVRLASFGVDCKRKGSGGLCRKPRSCVNPDESGTGFCPEGNGKSGLRVTSLPPSATTENRDRHKPDRCAGLSLSRFPGRCRRALVCQAYHIVHVFRLSAANPERSKTLRKRGLAPAQAQRRRCPSPFSPWKSKEIPAPQCPGFFHLSRLKTVH